MTQYDLTFLLNKEEELKKIKDLITALKGKVVKEISWGKKTLSYPIKKNTSAYFYNWQIEIDHKTVKNLRKKLNYSENLIRYLLLVQND